MVLTTHLLVGAAIASKVFNPALALPLAFLSHYPLDLAPHTEYEIKNIQKARWHRSFFDFLKVFLDIFFGILLISLFSNGNPIIFAAALLAIVPDGLELLNIIFPNYKPLTLHQKFHTAIHRVCNPEVKKISPLWGIIIQIVVIVIAIFLLL